MMFKRLREKLAKAKAQREQEAREALAIKAVEEADKLVYMTEIERRFRAGEVDFGLDSHLLLEVYGLKNERVIIGGLQYIQLLERRKKIDEGSLTLTNERLLFSPYYGTKGSQEIMLNEIVSVQPHDSYDRNGIAIRREGKKQTQYLVNIIRFDMDVEVFWHKYKVPFTGEQMVWLIEGAIGRASNPAKSLGAKAHIKRRK